MKSKKKSTTIKPSLWRRVARRWPVLILCLIAAIGAGIAATRWLGNSRRPSTSDTAADREMFMNRYRRAAALAGAPGATPVPPSLPSSTNVMEHLAAAGLTNDPLQMLNGGNLLLEQGDVEGAIALYLKALKLSPEDEEVHFNLGFAFAKQGKHNEAIRYYTEALRIFPDYAEAHNNLGNVMRSLRRYEEAATHFSAALKVNPDSDSALNNLGRCLAEMGRTSEAIVQFGEAIRLNPNYLEALFNLGNAQLILGNKDQAVRAFEQALKINPSFTPASKGLERARAKPAGGPRQP